MSYPLHGSMAVAPLRAVAEASLTDVGVVSGKRKTRLTNGEYIETPFSSDPIPCSLRVLGAAEVEIAAARGIEASVAVDVPIGTTVRPGNTITVTRATDDEAWTRTVRVTGVDLPNGVMVTATAVDVALNQ